MKKVLLLTMCFLLLLGIPCSAQSVEELYNEQLEASGGEALWDALPTETKALLEKLGITELKPDALAETDTQTVLEQVWALVLSAAKEPLKYGGVIFGIVILHAWVAGFHTTLNGQKSNDLFSAVAALASCAAVIEPISRCIVRVGETTESLSVFMISFVPVYAGILLSGGAAASAFSFQSVALYAAQLLSLISHSVIVPLMSISLGIGLIGAVTPGVRLGNVGAMIGKGAAWLLSLGSALFSGLLSLQSLAGSAADTLGGRALKFSLSSLVPVVGGSLSEAFSTVRGCLGVLRSTVGCFGIGACALLVLPPLLSCLVWNVCLAGCRMSAEMFELQPLVAVIQTAQTVLKCLIAVLLAGALFTVIAVTVVTVSAAKA